MPPTRSYAHSAVLANIARITYLVATVRTSIDAAQNPCYRPALMNGHSRSVSTRNLWLPALAVAALSVTACHAPRESASRPVSDAWADNARQRPQPESSAAQPVETALMPVADDDVIALVDGRPISRSQLVNLLLAGHGVGILEQLVVLECARSVAAQQGLVVTQFDIDAEYERSLRTLSGPLQAAPEQAPFDRDQAERVLAEVLSRRNVSRAECLAMVTRNAFLRAIVSANMTFTDEQLRAEFERSCGPRVEIRHIQSASIADAERVAGLLGAGEDFADLATRYSANARTAVGGGLLRSFSASDDQVPAALRDAAFRMHPGEVSNPLRVDEWYHIVKIERRLPADSRSFEQLRSELENRLRERLTTPAMQTLYTKLFEQADIHIVDPGLAVQFARKHPERAKP